MISNSECCSLSITECTEMHNLSPPQSCSTTIYETYSTTIYTEKNFILDSKTTQVPISPTSMATSETPLIKYVTVCPPVSYQTPSPCLTDMLPVSKSQESKVTAVSTATDMLPVSNSQEYKATAVSTATESINIKETVIYSVGAVVIALLLGTNISLCVALWIKRNQMNKSELFPILKHKASIFTFNSTSKFKEINLTSNRSESVI